MKLAARFEVLLLGARASSEPDHSREGALNVLLIASLALALLPAVQRVVQISQGGPGTADHVQTLAVASVAAAVFGLLLLLSRRGKSLTASYSLLGVYYLVGAWSVVAEGPGKNTTILISALFVVAAAALCGSRPAAVAALLIGTTMAVGEALDATHVLAAPRESSPAVPDALGAIEIVGTLGTMALVLWARTRARIAPVSASPGDSPLASAHGDLRSGALTIREIQVVQLVALGRSNDDISRELVVSPRTVHSHVSSALRKTGCANRTELAVLAVREGLNDRATR
jgi:DNA-binding CsgD family transcriptional regulator